jgi:hypothetical protein
VLLEMVLRGLCLINSIGVDGGNQASSSTARSFKTPTSTIGTSKACAECARCVATPTNATCKVHAPDAGVRSMN